MRLAFTVPGLPRPKARPRLGKHGNVYTPLTTVQFERDVGVYALASFVRCGWRVTCEPCRIHLHVFLGSRRRVDLDNIAKSVLDGLNRLAVADDSQFVEGSWKSEIDANNPRVYIELETIDGGGA